MSINTHAEIDQMFDEVMQYFDELKNKALPEAKEELLSLHRLKTQSDEKLSDKMVNHVFKDKRLLKAAMRCRKKQRKKRKNIEDDEDVSDGSNDNDDIFDNEEDDDDETGEIDKVTAPLFNSGSSNFNEDNKNFAPYVKRYKITEDDRNALIKRAQEHAAYLRRMRGKSWDKMEKHEHQKVDEYIASLSQWVERIDKEIDYQNFLCEALPIYQEAQQLQESVREETERAKTTAKPVQINRVHDPEEQKDHTAQTAQTAIITTTNNNNSVYLPPPPLFKAPTIEDSLGIIRSESHERLLLLHKQMKKITDYTLGLYGKVRKSGSVVDRPEVPVAKAMPLAEQQIDPWIASGLMCAECAIMRIIDIHTASATCPECGVSIVYQDQSLRAYNYGDEPEIKKKTRNYSPKSYGMQWLRRVQGKLGKEIPEDVWATLFKEFHSKRYTHVDEKIVHRTLKRKKLNEYYSMVPFITNKFNEVPLAEFSEEELVILDKMFEEAYAAFQKCPSEIKQRQSFISYPYFYHKSVELRGWNHYKRCFPLLDGDANIRKHDKTWRWICENKEGERWTFIATIP